MSPTGISSAGLTQGVPMHVTPGVKVGQVGNWMKTDPNQTTAHLHFEIRKQHEMCGTYGCTVAPYWTLIRAYERFINAQGTEVK
jgi:murein DD-endopeptidase MepM/ murein hydrolase activator NlpD